MQVFADGRRIEEFWRGLAGGRSLALLLDYDGTLAPFVAAREEATPYPGVPERLERLMERDRCRVSLVSGRGVASLAALLPVRRLPEIWGSHGVERRWSDGRVERPEIPAATSQALERAADRARTLEAGEALELKSFSVAYHRRARPPAADRGAGADADHTIRHDWDRIAGEVGLEVRDFDGGYELRVPGHDKGVAVRTLQRELGPDWLMAYLGDDDTDEDAFRALRPADLGVLVRAEPRPTAAHLRIRPPGELLALLDRLDHHVGGEAR